MYDKLMRKLRTT